MANKLDAFPSAAARRYEDLEEWLDGSVWELHQGEDFDKARAVRSALAAAARRRDRRVRTRLAGDDGKQKLVVQAYTPQDANVPPTAASRTPGKASS